MRTNQLDLCLFVGETNDFNRKFASRIQLRKTHSLIVHVGNLKFQTGNVRRVKDKVEGKSKCTRLHLKLKDDLFT